MNLTAQQQKFKQVRRELQMGQIDFAHHLELAQGRVSVIESGRAEVSDKTLQKLIKNLHVNPDWWATGKQPIFTKKLAFEKKPRKKAGAPGGRKSNDANPNKKALSEQADRLRFFRDKEELTGKLLAQELGITPGTYSKYESGTITIPIDVIIHLRNKYQLNYEWFFDGRGTRKLKADDKSNIITDIAKIFEVQHATRLQVTSLQEKQLKYIEEIQSLKSELNTLKIQFNNR
jgi:transcriptional regulator with XRE-family HTH domain